MKSQSRKCFLGPIGMVGGGRVFFFVLSTKASLTSPPNRYNGDYEDNLIRHRKHRLANKETKPLLFLPFHQNGIPHLLTSLPSSRPTFSVSRMSSAPNPATPAGDGGPGQSSIDPWSSEDTNTHYLQYARNLFKGIEIRYPALENGLRPGLQPLENDFNHLRLLYRSRVPLRIPLNPPVFGGHMHTNQADDAVGSKECRSVQRMLRSRDVDYEGVRISLQCLPGNWETCLRLALDSMASIKQWQG